MNLIPPSRLYRREAERLRLAVETAPTAMREDFLELARRYEGFAAAARLAERGPEDSGSSAATSRGESGAPVRSEG